jgi:predicted restriction endonuclease
MSNAYFKRYYAAHKEEIKARAREYYETHREEQRARQNAKLEEIRKIVLEHYGSRCACCGETEPQFLNIDHVNSDGAAHRRALGNLVGSSFYRWIIKHHFPNDLQLLCCNCNMAKGLYGICPHQERKGSSGS